MLTAIKILGSAPGVDPRDRDGKMCYAWSVLSDVIAEGDDIPDEVMLAMSQDLRQLALGAALLSMRVPEMIR